MQLLKKFEKEEIPHVDWLDKFVGKAIERVHEMSASDRKQQYFLYVTFPTFPYPVVFYQKV